VESKVQSSLEALGASEVNAQQYMVMAALLSFLERGHSQRHMELQDWDTAAMVAQSFAQRNAQWAAEERLFSRIVHPMMTFFEAFLFAVSPLMVFVIGLGPIGFRMVGKYMLMALWIQLWMPVLAIVNLFVQMAMTYKLDALQDPLIGNLQLPSFYALYKMDFLLQDYLATGGMLAASTPAIALMLIYGSAITATHLAGRLQGGDFVDEKMISPDILKPAPALGFAPSREYSPLTDVTTTNADDVLWRFDIGSGLESNFRSSQQHMEQAGERFSDTLANTAASTAARNHESFDERAMAWSYGASGSATDRALLQEGEALANKYLASGITGKQMSGLLGYAIGSGKDGLSLGQIKGELRGTYSVNDSLVDQIASDIQQRATSDQGFEARLAEAVEADARSGARNVFSDRLSSEDSSRLAHEASEVVTASRSLEHAESMYERFGTMQSLGMAEMSHGIVAKPCIRNRVAEEISSFGLTGDVQMQTGYYSPHLPADQAAVAASMSLLLGHSSPAIRHLTPSEQEDAQEAGLNILSATFGFGDPNDPAIRNVLQGSDLSYFGVRQHIEDAGLSDPRADVSALPGEIDEHGRIVSDGYGTGAVDQFHAGTRGDVAAGELAFRNTVRADQHDAMADLIEQRAMLPRSAPEKIANDVGGFAIQSAESGALAMAGLGGMADSAARAYGETLQQGGSYLDAAAAAVISAGSAQGWEETRNAMVDARMNQIAGYGLTDAQVDYFRESTETVFGFLPDEACDAARAAVVAESGPIGEHVADLIQRSAESRDDTSLRMIGAYNRTEALPEEHSTPIVPGTRSIGVPPLHEQSDAPGIYGPLLDLISRPESHGNYDAWFGNVNQSDIDLSSMTVNQVLTHQSQLLEAGNGGSAIGRYELIPNTLRRVADDLRLSGNEPFTDALQDRMALRLLREAGVNGWLRGEIDSTKLAFNMSRVWAGLPKDESNESYYQEDGINRAHIDYNYVTATLESIRNASGLEKKNETTSG
jgi:conjugal transfer mating pair stabilization protein TraG